VLGREKSGARPPTREAGIFSEAAEAEKGVETCDAIAIEIELERNERRSTALLLSLSPSQAFFAEREVEDVVAVDRSVFTLA